MFRLLKLEDRIVLDGAAVVEALDEFSDQDVHDSQSDHADDASDSTDGEYGSDTPLYDVDEPAGGKHVLVVPNNIKGSNDLVKAAKDDVIVVGYNANNMSLDDLSDTISDALGGEPAASIAFAAHSSESAEIQLGKNQIVSLESLSSDDAQQAFWKEIGALTKDGRIDLLGCNVIAGEDGEAFLASLEALTGVNVAASVDDTGNEVYGGDWVLESDGVDVAETYFNADQLEEFEGVLQNSPPTNGIRGIPSISKTNEADGTTTYLFAFPSNTFTDPDGDTLTYTAQEVVNGTPTGTLPTWNGGGLFFFNSSLSFYGVATPAEYGDTYTIRVTASDGFASDSIDFNIAVPGAGEVVPVINDPGTIGSVPESPSTGTGDTIVDLDVTDSDSSSFAWSIVSGNPLASNGDKTFAINSDGQITVNNPERLDYEDPLNPNHEFSLIAQVQDDQGLYASKTVNFKISDVTGENLPFVSLDLSGPNIFDEATGQTTVTVNLSKQVTTNTTISFNYSGAAVAGTDFTAPANIIFSPTDGTSKTFIIDGIADATSEGAEDITVSVVDGTNYNIGSVGQVTATITDEPIPPTVNLNLTGPSSFLENGGVTTVTATATQAPATDLTIPLNFGGTATFLTDYSAPNEFITISAGQTSGTLQLTGIFDFDDTEGAEPLTVSIDETQATGFVVGTTNQVAATITDEAIGPPVVSLSLTGASLFEEAGGQTTVAVNLSRPVDQDLVISLSYLGGVAVKGTDFNAPDSITITPTDGQSKTFTITGITDATQEGAESIQVSLVDTVDYDVSTTNAQVTATITDEVIPTVDLSLTGPVSFAEDTGQTTVTATVSQAPTADLTIPLTVTGTAIPGTDIDVTATPTITILAGQTAGTLVIPGKADFDEAEGDEPFTVAIDSTQVSGFNLGTVTDVTATVTDAPAPPIPTVFLSVSPTTFSEDQGNTIVTATLDQTTIGDVTVPLNFGGVALKDTDYTASSTQILIPAGSKTGTITLKGTPDDDPTEGDETVQVLIDQTNLTGAVASTTANQVTAFIEEATPPFVSLSGGGTIDEATQSATTITATLDAATDSEVTVVLDPVATADLGQDFTAVYKDTGNTVATDTNGNWLLSIQPGSTSNGIVITAIDDVFFETDETINLQVTSITNGKIDTAADLASVTILDDDQSNIPVVSLTQSTLSVNEGTTGTITVSLDQVASADVSVLLDTTAITGAPALGTDYQILDETGTALTPDTNNLLEVTIPVNDNAVNLQVKALTDTVFEKIWVDAATPNMTQPLYEPADEEFSVTIDSAVNAQADPAAQTTDVTIGDTTTAPTVALQVTQTSLGTSGATPPTFEEDGGTATLSVDLTPATGTTIEYGQKVLFSTSGVARAGIDYSLAALTTDANDKYVADVPATGSETVLVQGISDTIFEGEEEFTLTAEYLADTSAANLKIVNENDTDDGPAVVSVGVAPATFAENGGQTTVTVSLDHAVAGDVTVSYGFAGVATQGTDYEVTDSAGNPITTFEVTIPEGQTSETFIIDAIDDITAFGSAFFEGDETVEVQLTGVTPAIAGNASLSTVNDTATATILEENPEPTVSLKFQNGVNTFSEGVGTKLVQAVLSYKSVNPVVVDLGFDPSGTDTATQGVDYTLPASTQITIAANKLSNVLGVSIVDDTVLESDETFTAEITNVTGGTAGTPSSVTGTIQDNDAEGPAQVLVSFQNGDAVLDEGTDTATVEFFVDRAITSPLTMDLTFAGTADIVDDYSATVVGTTNEITTSTYTLTIPTSTSAQTIELLLDGIADGNFEGVDGELIDFTVSNLSGGQNAFGTASLSGGVTSENLIATIVEDPAAQPEVSLAFAGTGEFEEGQTAQVVASLSGTTTQDVTVTIAAQSSGGVLGVADPGTDFKSDSAVTTAHLKHAVTIPAGSTTGTLQLLAVNDTEFEGNETFQLDIESVSTGAKNETPDSITGTILDNDTAPTVSLNPVSLTTDEDGTPLNAVVNVALSSASVGDMTVTVDLAATGTTASYDALNPANGDFKLAVEGNEAGQSTEFGTFSTFSFSGSNLVLNWDLDDQLADQTVSLTFTAVQDTEVEADEFVVAELANVTDGLATINTTAATQTVTIADDDYTAPTLTLAAQNGVVDFLEDPTDPNFFPVRLNLNLSSPAQLPFPAQLDIASVTTGGSLAVPGVDYKITSDLAGSNVINFDSVDTTTGTGSITVSIAENQGVVPLYFYGIDDTVFEGDEIFNVSINATSVEAFATVGTPGSADLTVIEDDAAPEVSLSLGGTTFSETGGGTLPLNINLTSEAPTTETVTLTFGGTASLVGSAAFDPKDYAVVDSTGASVGTIDTVAGTIAIDVPANTTNYQVFLQAQDDTVYEGEETVQATITNVTGSLTIDPDTDPAVDGTVNTVTATLLDDDDAAKPSINLAVSPTSFLEDTETGAVTLNLSSASGAITDVTLNFAGEAIGEDAAAGQDYTATYTAGTMTGTLTITNGTASFQIPPGETTATVNLLPIAETVFENDETISVSLADPGIDGDYTIGTTGSVEATIANDDTAPTVSLSLSQTQFVEGATTDLQFNLSATSGGTATATIEVDTAASTATIGEDFSFFGATLVDGTTNQYTVTIPAGTTQSAVQIQAVDDTLYEGGAGAFEDIVINLISVTGGAKAATPTSSVTAQIEDNDTQPTISLAVNPATIYETDADPLTVDTAQITVSLSEVSGMATTFDLTITDVTTTALTDYEVNSGLGTTGLIIPAGSLTAQIPLTALSDADFEPAETLKVGITNVVGATGTPADVEVTIVDTTPPPEVDLSPVGFTSPATATEGQAATLTVNATLGAAIFQNETVTLDLSGTAVYGTDFTVLVDSDNDNTTPAITPTVVNGQFDITFTDGTTPVSTIPIQLTFGDVDNAFKDARDITLTVADPGNLSNDTPTPVVINIQDDDPAPRVTLVSDSTTIGETGTPVAGITAQLVDDLGNPITSTVPVTVTLDPLSAGNAELGGTTQGVDDDFDFSATEVTIPAGSSVSDTAFFFGIDELAGSEVYEGNETFTVGISNVVNALPATDPSQTITIVEDEIGPTVNLSVTPQTIAEASGVASVIATLGSPSPIEEVVYVTYTGTATFGTDYTASVTSVNINGQDMLPITITQGSTQGKITLTAVDDAALPVFEPDETIEVAIGETQNNLQLGTNTAGATTILDDDEGIAPTVSFSDTTLTVLEGNAATFSINLDQASNGEVTLTLDLAGSIATEGALPDDFQLFDFSGVTGAPDPFTPVTFTNGQVTVTIPAGTTAAPFQIVANDDNVFEGDEIIDVDITGVIGAKVDTAADELLVTIDDTADIAEIAIQLDTNLDGTLEGTTGSINETDADQSGKYFVITKSSDTAEAITVDYTIAASSTAAAGEDYVYTSGTWKLGVDAGNYALPAVQLLGDDLDEGTLETLTITLSNPSLGEISTTAGSATLNITDDDSTPTVSVNTGLTAFSEGAVVQISDTDLAFIDADAPADDPATTDVNENLASIVYTLVSGPNDGILFKDVGNNGATGFNELEGDVALTAGSTFTQEDIDNGAIYYDHYGPGNDPATGQQLTDEFTFTVTDGTNIAYADPALQTPFVFNIAADNVNDIPDTGNDVFDKTENEAGLVGIIATDVDPGDDLAGNSSIVAGDPNGQFELVQTTTVDGVEQLELHVVTGNTLDYEDMPSYTLQVSVNDGLAGAQTQLFVVNVVDVAEPGDDFEPGTIPDQTWLSSDTDAFIYQVDVETVFPKDGVVVYSASGMPSWLSFQTSTATFWALPDNGQPTTTTTYPVTVNATYYDGNGEVQGVTSTTFNFTYDVVASLESQALLDALQYLEGEEPAALPEEGEAVEVQQVMVAQAQPAAEETVPAEVAEYAEVLALLENQDNEAAA